MRHARALLLARLTLSNIHLAAPIPFNTLQDCSVLHPSRLVSESLALPSPPPPPPPPRKSGEPEKMLSIAACEHIHLQSCGTGHSGTVMAVKTLGICWLHADRRLQSFGSIASPAPGATMTASGSGFKSWLLASGWEWYHPMPACWHQASRQPPRICCCQEWLCAAPAGSAPTPSTQSRQQWHPLPLPSTWSSAAKVSDSIWTVRILKVSFYAYFMRIRIFRTVSFHLYVKYRLIRIFFFYCRAWDFSRKKLAALLVPPPTLLLSSSPSTSLPATLLKLPSAARWKGSELRIPCCKVEWEWALLILQAPSGGRWSCHTLNPPSTSQHRGRGRRRSLTPCPIPRNQAGVGHNWELLLCSWPGSGESPPSQLAWLHAVFTYKLPRQR